MKQESLPGYGKLAAKPKKAKNTEPWKKYVPTFYGTVHRQPTQHDGTNVSCPCGRVYLLPYARGGVVVYDSGSPLGKRGLGVVGIVTAKSVLSSKGCRLHVNADLRNGVTADPNNYDQVPEAAFEG